MQTDTLRVTVLPELGGKIASLRWLPGDLELLQQPLAPYAPRTMTMGFEESDASGFDECLPSVAACSVPLANRVAHVPDHGDFWRLPCAYGQDGNSIRMIATGDSLPLRFERTVSLEKSTLSVAYRLTNVGDTPLPWAWSAHPLFAVDRGDLIVLPGSAKQVTVEGSARERLGRKHAQHSWPRTTVGGGVPIDLSVAGGIADGIGDKLFTPAPVRGWAAIERLSRKVRIELQFDPQKIPWLGLWLCYGGWPEGKPNRQQCVAIEPCTAPVDSLAEAMAAGSARTLAPGASAEWGLRIAAARVS
ncbi:MAG TPA: aldose epimerase [Acidobacteriaceae bacterium]|nr:aldose epimerase [Acidobacteriaceae bacterium]